MNNTSSETNKSALETLQDILTAKRNSDSTRVVVFAGAAISMHSPSHLPTANAMLRATIRLLLQDSLLGKTLQESGLCWKLYRLIWRNCASSNRSIPPEMIYDAIYEFAGKKVFSALDCLRSNEPNLNHKTLAALLERGFIDHIITTNFDTLIEQSLTTEYAPPGTSDGPRIWKIHGDLRTPSSMATTIRQIGQTAFDEKLVNQLRNLLEGSHVLFVGYSGMDPDLMPAFRTANMKSVYWCVYDSEELNLQKKSAIINREPCKTISEKGIRIRWIVGDLQKELLAPLSTNKAIGGINSLVSVTTSTGSNKKDQTRDSPLKKSMNKWDHSYFKRLSVIEKARAILQILYFIALYSPTPDLAWILLIQTADAMERDRALSIGRHSEFRRDLHAFRAEAYLKLGEKVEQLHDELIFQTLQPPMPLPTDTAKQLDDILKKLFESHLNIENLKPSPAKQIEQLYVHAKNHLTAILPLTFQDAVQVQALLNASTILASSAGNRSEEGLIRNIEGAKKILEQAIQITNRTKMENNRGDILKARCYSNLGVLLIESGNPQDGLKLFDKAEGLFKKSGDLYSYAGTCLNTGLLLMNLYHGHHIQMYKDEAANYLKNAKSTLDAFPNQMLSNKAMKLEMTLLEENQ